MPAKHNWQGFPGPTLRAELLSKPWTACVRFFVIRSALLSTVVKGPSSRQFKMLLLTSSFLLAAMCYLLCKPFPLFTISSTNFLALSSKPITISPHPTSLGPEPGLTPTSLHNTTLHALSHSQALTGKVSSQMHLLTHNLHPPMPAAHSPVNKAEPSHV